ncbi:MAG: SGNH/GDSL hydrolase family protein [Candidatus Nanopelagicales bacterium]|nr:SGNH/GDSL hydrolase family protein [Candidatus Nanopelagicales bacterium]MCU0298942.1 SGNH/GDSL hydrolase family protein [Candidatus Nanopelagicales bacterium]
MIRAAHAKRIAMTAAYGGGGLIGAGAAAFGVAFAQGRHARNEIGVRRKAAPYADGLYGARRQGTSQRFVVLGDSVAAGLGAEHARNTPGAMLAQGMSNVLDKPVRLVNVATVGARSADLPSQVERALLVRPNVAVIVIGANDITHVGRPQAAVAHLEQAVRRLRGIGCEVVVGTCPDVGCVRPIPQPLRWVARRLSRQLAAAQAIACVREGAHVVSFADELGPEFDADPELFAEDRFHPSPEGYERVTQVLFPAVLAALDSPRVGDETSADIMELSEAAVDAAGEAGTHLVAGGRGPRGPWALIRRVRRSPVPGGDETGVEPA